MFLNHTVAANYSFTCIYSKDTGILYKVHKCSIVEGLASAALHLNELSKKESNILGISKNDLLN